MRFASTLWIVSATLVQAGPAYQSSFYFEPNLGQAPESVRYFSVGDGLMVLIEEKSVKMSLDGRSFVTMTLDGSQEPARVRGQGLLSGISNYLDRKPNLTGVPHYSAVRLDRVYPGIDMIYKADRSQFEYDFHVAPNADPAAIRLRFSTDPRLLPDGDLLIDTPYGVVRQHRPVAFQVKEGQRVQISAQFQIIGSQVTFSLGDYDRSRELVIDPPVTYLTFLGSPTANNLLRIKADGSGALYIFSAPGITAQTSTIGAAAGVAVTKFDSLGQLVYSTRLDLDFSAGVPLGATGVDSAGFAYLAAYSSTSSQLVLSKLNQAGTAEVFRRIHPYTNLYPEQIAIDASSHIYLAGRIAFQPTTFTATAGALRTSGEGFFIKFTPDGLNAALRTFTPSSTKFFGLAVDATGALYFNTSLPVAWNATTDFGLEGGNSFGFAKLSPDFSSLLYSINMSGTNIGPIGGLAIDSSNNLFVVGGVNGNSQFAQPLPGTSTTLQGNACLVKINATGTAVLFARQFGGSGYESQFGMALDAAGNAWIGGITESTDLPLVGASQTTFGGIRNGFLTQIKGDGSAVLFSTYVGNNTIATTSGDGLVAADNGAAYLAFHVPNFGTLSTVNAFQPLYGTGGSNIVVGKWGSTTPVNQTPTVNSVSPAYGFGTSSTRSFVFGDTNGANDLGIVNVLINSSLDGRHACYIAYDSVNNVLVLVNDTGDNATVLALPATGSLSNSQCSIAGSGISAVKAGNQLTLTLTFNFTDTFSGSRIVFAAARDAASGNSGWQPIGTQTISVPAANPQPVAALPASGTNTAGTTYPITIQYRDATASTNLQPTQLLINSDLNGLSGCYFGFDHAANLLYIVGDNGVLQPTPIRLNGAAGGAVSIENSQCIVQSAGSTFTDVGVTLTITLQIQFKPSFAGRRLLFGGAQTTGGMNSGWSVLGSLTIQ